MRQAITPLDLPPTFRRQKNGGREQDPILLKKEEERCIEALSQARQSSAPILC